MKITWVIVASFCLMTRATAGEYDVARRIFKLSEAYYAAECEVISTREPQLAAFSEILRTVRLVAINGAQREIDNAEAGHLPLVVKEGGWCGVYIRTSVPSFDSPEVKALGTYVSSHPKIDLAYVAATEKHNREILRKSQTDRAEALRLVRLFIPEMDAVLPNKSPETTRGR